MEVYGGSEYYVFDIVVFDVIWELGGVNVSDILIEVGELRVFGGEGELFFDN